MKPSAHLESTIALSNDKSMLKRRKTYYPLDPRKRQIRLLHLLPASDGNATIHCTKRIVSLDDPDLEYEALSYVWGDKSNNQIIQLDSIPQEVTWNLFEALKNIRNEESERVMWVDAVCIDQESLQERSEQVMHMHDIYSRASTVLIYLGPCWSGIEHTWRLFEIFGSNTELHIDPDMEQSVGCYGIDVKGNDLFAAVQHFMNFPWWMRIWTAQEWHLAKRSKVQCGQKIIDGNLVFKTAFYFHGHAAVCCRSFGYSSTVRAINAMFTPLAFMIVRRDHTPNTAVDEEEDFLSMVATFRWRQATNPRDKIYGLLALAHHLETYVTKVDYTATTEQIYTDWALSVIQGSRSLDILGFVLEFERCLRMPSWVPDWSGRMYAMTASELVDRRRLTLPRVYNACKDQPAVCRAEHNKLTVRGRVVDTIITITNFDGQKSPNAVQALHEAELSWTRLVKQNTVDLKQKSRSKEAFFMAICGGMMIDLETGRCHRRPPIADFLPFEKWKAWFSSADSFEIPDSETEMVERAASTTNVGRIMALTENERIGWVPRNARVGDVIAVLTGGRMPIVLRPREGGYTVFGEAYVHGIMDGEAMPDNDRLKDIVLI